MHQTTPIISIQHLLENKKCVSVTIPRHSFLGFFKPTACILRYLNRRPLCLIPLLNLLSLSDSHGSRAAKEACLVSREESALIVEAPCLFRYVLSVYWKPRTMKAFTPCMYEGCVHNVKSGKNVFTFTLGMFSMLFWYQIFQIPMIAFGFTHFINEAISSLIKMSEKTFKLLTFTLYSLKDQNLNF